MKNNGLHWTEDQLRKRGIVIANDNKGPSPIPSETYKHTGTTKTPKEILSHYQNTGILDAHVKLNDLIIQLRPVPKPRMTSGDQWKKRPVVQKYWEYCALLREACAKNNFVLPDVLSMTFVFDMPTSWSLVKRGRMAETPHQNRPDLDNIIKAVKDALAKNDSYVWRYNEIKKIWGYTPAIIFHY